MTVLWTMELRNRVRHLVDALISGVLQADATPSAEVNVSDTGQRAAKDQIACKTTGERIEWDLHRAGGRLWQRDLVASLDVSEATVSRWLCRLEEQGRVERVTRGREKLVVLPGAVPKVETDETGRPAEV